MFRKPGPVVLLVAAAALLGLPATAPAAPEQAPAPPVNVLPGTIATDVQAKLQRDGTLTVTERITVPDGPPVHRTIPLRQRTGEGADRVFTLTDARVDGGEIAVGPDAARLTVLPGEATFDYTVHGAVAEAGDLQEIRWQLSGGWDLPVDRVSASLLAPQVPQDITCLAGPVGGQERCGRFEIGRTRQVHVLEFGLAAGERLDLSMRVPAGAVPSNAMTERRFDPAYAFSLTPAIGVGLAGMGLLLIGGFGVLWHFRGRDVRASSAPPGPVEVLMVSADGTTVFASPDGVLPGQIGTVADERVDLVDVAATVVDLAVRNYLWIEELAGDWRIVRRNDPDSALREYERAVHDVLVGDRRQVLLSELAGRDLAPVREALYAEVVANGWFGRRPDAERNLFWWGGAGLAAAGVLLTALLALTGPLGLIGVAVALGGVALSFAARLMPARTARGSVLVGQIQGLRNHLRKVSVDAIPVADRETAFSRSLPYALVLGEAGPWLEKFAALDPEADGAPGLYWYGATSDLERFRETFPAFAARLCAALGARRGSSGSPEPVTNSVAPR
ncbi:DUF2207 domain-containing protein [Saccharopolyspora gloriosae]|uniref:DUF2207 domain-containing protein n=1 Tax=Saccharopolyspora gloriosae TaxID=455344 RepID=UPI001FB72157|nr:DUF2207 domain-containing protein [Saccharopolyspora gloriosae]